MSSFNIYELIFGFNFNKHKIKCLVVTFLLIIFFPFNASYSNNLCDNLAALESDPNRTSKPILFEDLMPDQVIKNCTSAIQKSKNSENISRFYLQRARGYLKTGNITDAVSDLNKSYELGYPVAAFALATLFYLGDDVTQDFELAKKLYLESYDDGVIWAAKGLYFLYSDPSYINNDNNLANKWKNLFESSIKE